MLFIKKAKDGRLEPVSGRVDPELSVKEITSHCRSFFSSRIRKAENQPNIVIILADDLGYGDIALLQPQVETRDAECGSPGARGDAIHRRSFRLGGVLADAIRPPHRTLRLAHSTQERRPRPLRSSADRGGSFDPSRDAQAAGLSHGLRRQMAPRLELAEGGRQA